jgi:hypothetical protein
MFTGLLPSNGLPSIVGCGLVGTCLPLRLLATAQYVTLILIAIEVPVNQIIQSRTRYYSSRKPPILENREVEWKYVDFIQLTEDMMPFLTMGLKLRVSQQQAVSRPDE